MAFGCHPDDVEFLCAGTLALLAQRGCELHIAVMAGGEMGSPTPPGPFGITSAALAGTGLLRIQWQAASPNYRYNLEKSVGLPPNWQPAAGPNVWPILPTEATVPVSGNSKFFRVKAELF